MKSVSHCEVGTLKRIPDVFVIVTLCILLAAAATWLLPGGSFERQEEQVGESTRLVVVDGSFEYQQSKPQTLEVFTAPIKGFERLAAIIGFIFIVGGAFFMLNETGAIAAGIHKLVDLLKGREFLVIPIVMTLFSLFGAVFGMCEEAMPFALIFVPLAIALGYDSLVGVSLTFLAAGVGFAGAFINPFTVQIAQGLAGVEPLSGMGYRVLVWIIATSLTISWVMIYGARIKKDPKRSPMYELDQKRREEIAAQSEAHAHFTKRHGLALLTLGSGTALMILGVTLWDWYIYELSGLFFAMGLLAAVFGGQGPNAMAKSFIAGCRDIAPAAIVVGFAGGIVIILEDGRVMDTILYGMSSLSSSLPPMGAASLQYFLQLGVNFFVPSGTTQAAITMPIMAPLAELSGLSRQTAVLIYQFGDGFTNMIIPTSGVTVGTLSMAKIPYQKWFKWNAPMQVVFIIMAHLLLIWPVMSGW